jgi:hypothetical protein
MPRFKPLPEVPRRDRLHRKDRVLAISFAIPGRYGLVFVMAPLSAAISLAIPDGCNGLRLDGGAWDVRSGLGP